MLLLMYQLVICHFVTLCTLSIIIVLTLICLCLGNQVTVLSTLNQVCAWFQSEICKIKCWKVFTYIIWQIIWWTVSYNTYTVCAFENPFQIQSSCAVIVTSALLGSLLTRCWSMAIIIYLFIYKIISEGLRYIQ